MLLQDFLHSLQVDTDQRRRHTDVLNEGDGLEPAAQTIQTRQGRLTNAPDPLDLLRLGCDPAVDGPAFLPLHLPGQ
jgi:hypothetical protein